MVKTHFSQVNTRDSFRGPVQKVPIWINSTEIDLQLLIILSLLNVRLLKCLDGFRDLGELDLDVVL